MTQQGENLRKGKEEVSELNRIIQRLNCEVESAKQQVRRPRQPGLLLLQSWALRSSCLRDGCPLWRGLGFTCDNTPALSQHILWSLSSSVDLMGAHCHRIIDASFPWWTGDVVCLLVFLLVIWLSSSGFFICPIFSTEILVFSLGICSFALSLHHL